MTRRARHSLPPRIPRRRRCSAAALRAQNRKHVPVGLLIYAVLADWKKDFDGTLTAVAKMGYEGVELTQYESWTPARGQGSPGAARLASS